MFEIDAFLLSQVLAVISFGFGLGSYQFKNRRTILLCLVVCNIFNASHFFLLGRPGPASMLLVTGLRYSVAAFTTNSRIMMLFIAATAGVYLVFATNAVSLLACIGTVIATYGSFQADNCRLRLIVMVGISMWVTHNILAATPMGAIMESAFLISGVVGYWRHCRVRGDRGGVGSGEGEHV